MATSGGKPAVAPGGASAANVLDGFQSFTATSAAVTLVTVPAGRTWVGTVFLAVDCAVAAASTTPGVAIGSISVAGAGASPSAGAVLGVGCRAGAGAAGGTTGSQASNAGSTPLTVVAPQGNAVTIQVATVCGGTNADVNASAIGALQ